MAIPVALYLVARRICKGRVRRVRSWSCKDDTRDWAPAGYGTAAACSLDKPCDHWPLEVAGRVR